MLQFYFLSVFFNLIVGFVLINDQRNFIELPLLKERVFRLVLGVLSAVTGIIKLFVVVHTSAVIVGDFIPAAAGIAGGITLMIQDDNENLPEWFKKIFVANKFIVGIACASVAILHFVFPGALFL